MCCPTSSPNVKEEEKKKREEEKEEEKKREEEKDERVHYDGYQVIRALPDSQDQLDTLQTIGE